MRWMHAIFFSAITCFQASIYSEIETLTVKWTPMLCQESCIRGLEKQFQKINGVAGIDIRPAAGQAHLRWKPNVEFSLRAINGAMSMIGLSIGDIRTRVRGTIIHNNRTVSLISIGDNTRFILLGPITPDPTRAVLVYSSQTHPLSPALYERFLQAEAVHQIVVVEGPLFEPERSPPLKIIAERVQFIDPPPS